MSSEGHRGGESKQSHWEKKFRQQWRERKLIPQYVQWISTYKCNFSCPHCGTAAGKAREDELETHEILKAIDTLSDVGCRIFSVTGGEPLLRDDIFEVLSYAKGKGLAIGIVTNGYVTEEYAEKIKEVKLDSVLVSIDGHGENHERIRGAKGSYDRCLKSLDFYKEINVPVRAVSTVLLDDNVEDIPLIIEDVWEHGVTNQRIQPIIPEGRAAGVQNNPVTVKKVMRMVYDARERGINVEMSEGFGFLGRIDEELRSYDFFCGCGWNTFTIMHDGSVMGCPALDFPELSEGNIRERDLKRIWWNGFYKFRKTLYEDAPDKCKECEYLTTCRAGCWLFRANRADPCFLREAEELYEEMKKR